MSRLKRPPVLAVGDRVQFDGQARQVLSVTSQAAILEDSEDPHRVVAWVNLFEAVDFEVLFQAPRGPLPASGALSGYPEGMIKEAEWWERHIREVLEGVPPDAKPEVEPRPGYGPGTTLASRRALKAYELTVAGHQVSAKTIKNKCLRYRKEGLAALIDHRPVAKRKAYGSAPEALVEAMQQAVKEANDPSTRTASFLLWRTKKILDEREADIELPSQRTLYRLLERVTAGTHVLESAEKRRAKAHQDRAVDEPFGQLTVTAPGEVMQMDSTPLDVLVRLDSGVVGKVELTGIIDVATRTVTAAVLRPTTKSVDASALLARTMTPELMRPGWVDALRMSRSVLPYRRLLTIDERIEHAVARPVIAPEMIVCDHGKIFLSHTFRASCKFLQIDFQPTLKGSPYQKGHIERMLGTVATRFAQFLTGYTGRSVEHRGRHVEKENLWSLPELQNLLDEWVVAEWQNRPHDGLRDPEHPARMFTPNQRYAALVEACGYVPVALSGKDYIELLPTTWRAVNPYGIRMSNRTYDSPELGPLRGQDSGVTAKHGLWEVHRDPYDVAYVWVRNVRGDGDWIRATWKYLNRVQVPFGDMVWDHVSHDMPKATEEEIAQAVDELLTRAYAGPEQPARGRGRKPKQKKADKRVVARNKAGGSLQPIEARPARSPAAKPPKPAPEPDPEVFEEDDEALAEVIELGLFNPHEDSGKRL